jgi:ribosomal protein L44E
MYGMIPVTKELYCEKCGRKTTHKGERERLETNPVLVCIVCRWERQEFPFQKYIDPAGRFYL